MGGSVSSAYKFASAAGKKDGKFSDFFGSGSLLQAVNQLFALLPRMQPANVILIISLLGLMCISAVRPLEAGNDEHL